MKIIKNKVLPFGNYATINIFGILFTKRKHLSDISINHETIHSYQIRETGFVGIVLVIILNLLFNISFWWLFVGVSVFYIQYGFEYIIIRLFHKKQNDAYHDVSFEEEAHNNDENLEYIKTRKHFAWIKYIKLKSNH